MSAGGGKEDRGGGGGGGEEDQGGGGARRRLPRLKIPAKIWKNRRLKNHDGEDGLNCVKEQQQEQEEALEEVSRRLIIREEELFGQATPPEEEEEDQLQRDFEALRLQMWMAIHSTFTSSSVEQLEVLRSAMVSIQQQEAQDRRWAERPEDYAPMWRPQKCLSTHHSLLHNMVESRLRDAEEDESGGMGHLSSGVKRQVCQLGRRVKDDLLRVRGAVQDCYPPQMDILNVYAGLYHRGFSVRLAQLTASGPEPDDCGYLLFWINHCYPGEILQHQDLDGHIKTACLGPLLLQEDLDRLEDRYLTHKQDQVKLWLSNALRKEEEAWLSGAAPELIDHYCFSPLAVDVIQVIDSSLTEFRCAIKDQSKAQRLTVHLEDFLCSYRRCMEQFVKGNHGNTGTVIRAQLVCEQQLRDYISCQTGGLSEEQRARCVDTLSALRDCGYGVLTAALHAQMKVCLRSLWTLPWVDGSLPVVDSLLDALTQQLVTLSDLKPACRQSLLCVLHQDVALQYVKRMMKTRMRSRELQEGGAQRMMEDVQVIQDFFTEEGCGSSSWIQVILCSLSEFLRLQDAASLQLELVGLVRTCPDISGAHVSALLSLKTGLSASDVRSIRQSVEENRLLDVSTNHSPPFFSKVKVKWINNKINQMGLKT